MEEKNKKEIWKDITGYEGLYKVSNYGYIKSCERYVEHKRHGKLLLKEKIRKYGYGEDGRCSVTLSKDGFNRLFSVAKLVANHFIDNPRKFEKVIHKDGNRNNNRVSNLLLVTHRDVSIMSQNNRPKTSQFNGVHFDRSKNKYVATISVKGKRIILGSFSDETKAREAIVNFKNENHIKTRFSYKDKF